MPGGRFVLHCAPFMEGERHSGALQEGSLVLAKEPGGSVRVCQLVPCLSCTGAVLLCVCVCVCVCVYMCVCELLDSMQHSRATACRAYGLSAESLQC